MSLKVAFASEFHAFKRPCDYRMFGNAGVKEMLKRNEKQRTSYLEFTVKSRGRRC